MESLKITLISSGQPSANPRLVKEALTYANSGFSVSVIYCPISSWADPFDQKLFTQNQRINWTCAGYHPVHKKGAYLFARLRQKLYQKLFKIFRNNPSYAIRSQVLYSQELASKAKGTNADIYIGHNLGALPATVEAAKRNNGLAFFDFEDYHRGEDTEGSMHWVKTRIIEDNWVPQLYRATTASPLISDVYQDHYPQISFTTINNCFPLSYQPETDINNISGGLKLFWFSQYIGKNRGLEAIISGIAHTGIKDISLSLMGNCNEEIQKYFTELWRSGNLNPDRIIFIDPVEEELIPQIAAEHHIGVACELPYIRNRELCLTNKLFMYLLAGNAILASDTKAQKKFMSDHPDIGTVYQNGNIEQLSTLLMKYHADRSLLNRHRKNSYETAKADLNWDKEKNKILCYLNDINAA